jgi:hypothetical protein
MFGRFLAIPLERIFPGTRQEEKDSAYAIFFLM